MNMNSFDFIIQAITLTSTIICKLSRALLLVFLLVFNSNGLFAQKEVQGYYQVHAPNTFELAKYGDIPVDMVTGVPQINMPLMQFGDKGINLDISLSYHASGIKVDQEATWVGLGWVLNAGGVITRELRGQPDGYFGYNGSFYERTSVIDYDSSNSPTNYFDVVRTTLGRAASSNGTDNAADMFYYNFNGRSGKFFLDGNANAIFTKYEDFKVELVKPTGPYFYDGNYFIITDEMGIKYEFAQTEITSTHVGSSSSYTSAFYLTKITNPSGGEITIEYVQGGLSSYNYQKRCYSQAYFKPQGLTHALEYKYTSPCLNYDNRITSWVPKIIRNSSGSYIELVTSTTQRLDSELMPNNRLDYLILYDSDNNQQKKIRFNYSYFEANNSDKFPISGPNDTRSLLNYRLRLDSFEEISNTGQTGSRHELQYLGDNDPTTDDPYTLPYRLSPSQDHWGYYNNTNNITIFPSNPADKPFDQEPWMLALSPGAFVGPGQFGYDVPNLANREANGEATKAGSLQKIIYPTGGYTKFTFEPHDLNPSNSTRPVSGGLRIGQIETYDGFGSPVLKNYTYSVYGGTIEKCHSAANPYYTWLSQTLDPTSQAPKDPDFMAALGVPPAFVMERHVVKIDGSPQLLVRSGTGAFYDTVIESSPGNGETRYRYQYGWDDVVVGGDQSVDGILTPGDFYSTFVETYNTSVYPPYTRPMEKSYCIFPFPQFRDNSWRRGQLIEKTVYSQQGTLLSLDSLHYEIKALKVVPGYKVSAITDHSFVYSRYYDVGGMVKPIKQVSKIYSSNGSYLRTIKELDYSSTSHKQLTESRDYTSTGEIITTQYFYPSEYGNTFSTLRDNNFLLPIDIRRYKNGQLVSGNQTQYSANGLSLTTYQAELMSGDIPFNVSTPFTFNPRLSNSYNSDHTLLSQTTTDGKPVVFLWGYKGQFPVAKIQGASYEDVKLALNDISESFISSLRFKSQPSVSDLLAISGLRLNNLLKDALIFTYTYKPLVGMTSMTDAKGMTVYYEYDGFGRLKSEKDHNGKVLKAYDYHYRGQ